MQQVESEWSILKDLVKRVADQTFEWRTNDGPDCLQLGYVAATFLDNGYRVYFDRRARHPTGIFPGQSPISAEEWSLELKVTTSSVVWSVRCVPKVPGEFSSNQLAEKLVARLIKYNEDYTKACTP